jgi:uncharacterized protein YjbJ (UPF0337 family)
MTGTHSSMGHSDQRLSEKEESAMNADILEGKWKQIRGRAKEWWGRLTDDELDKINGKKVALVGLLQVRYGYAKQAAEKEVDRRLKEYTEASKSQHETAANE